MAVILFLLAIGVGAAIGVAVYDNNAAPASLTALQQTTDQFTLGQLLAAAAGLGFLLALLLVLAASSTRGRRARRRELRTAAQDMEDRIDELERDRARLRNDLTQLDQAVAERDAAIAHRDHLLTYKDEELVRRQEELLRRTGRPPAGAGAAPERAQHWNEPYGTYEGGPAAPPQDRPTRQFGPGHDERTGAGWTGPEEPTRPLRRPGGAT
jgi:TolA-binding protein